MTRETVITIDEAELTLRLMEMMLGLDRDDRQPIPARLLLVGLEQQGEESRELIDHCRRCAKVAMEFFAECVNDGDGDLMMTKKDRPQ